MNEFVALLVVAQTAAVVALAIWVSVLSGRVAMLEGRSRIDEELWRSQLGYNEVIDASLNNLEDRPWPGRN